nr:MAG TPA: hypothetical protein [Caudoviricetes sp.]
MQACSSSIFHILYLFPLWIHYIVENTKVQEKIKKVQKIEQKLLTNKKRRIKIKP